MRKRFAERVSALGGRLAALREIGCEPRVSLLRSSGSGASRANLPVHAAVTALLVQAFWWDGAGAGPVRLAVVLVGPPPMPDVQATGPPRPVHALRSLGGIVSVASRMASMPVLTFARGPRARLLILLLFLTILPLLWFGDSLSEHVVGLILAGLGVTILWFGLIPALRVGVPLKRGVQMQGTVVGAEQQKGQGVNDIPYTTHHPIVQFTTADGRTVEFTSGGGAAP